MRSIANDSDRDKVKTKLLRELERASFGGNFSEYCGEELARARRVKQRREALTDEQAYNEAEIRAKFADATAERLEQLRTRDRAGDGAVCLSSSHICPASLHKSDIEPEIAECVADIEAEFPNSDIEILPTKRGYTVIVEPAGMDIGDIGAHEDKSYDHIPANVEFRHGGSIGTARRERLKDASGNAGGGPRDVITEFSYNSRRRLMRLTGELERAHRCLFQTLTYMDEFPTEPDRWKRDLQTLRKRIERRIPEIAAIWRLEIEIRKSGERKGWYAPHYHLLIYNVIEAGWSVEQFRKLVAAMWTDIIAADAEAETREKVYNVHKHRDTCRFVQSWKHVAAYTSKELAKTAQCDVSAAYPEGVGRWWGYWNVDQLPWVPKVMVWVSEQIAKAAIRAMRKHADIKNLPFRSLTVMCDATQWLRKFSRLLDEPETDANSMRYVNPDTGELGAFIGPAGALP